MKISDSLFVLLLYAGCGSPDALGINQSAAGGATEAGDQFGAVLAVGNFNNDNYDDLVIGGPGEDSGAGAVFIFMGSAGGLGSGFYLKQSHAGGTNKAGHHLGASIATGDLNGDGYDDLVAGAPGEDSGAGNIGVWLGSAHQALDVLWALPTWWRSWTSTAAQGARLSGVQHGLLH